jgi:hypothetical protein
VFYRHKQVQSGSSAAVGKLCNSQKNKSFPTCWQSHSMWVPEHTIREANLRIM